MIWLVLVVCLGLVGLPWFAALGLTLIAYSASVGLDPLLIMQEFGRIAEMQELLAIPLLLWALALVQAQANPAAPGDAGGKEGPAAWTWSGKWMLQTPGPSATASGSADFAALLFLSSPALIVIWLVFQTVSPSGAPLLQQLLLSGLLAAFCAAVIGVALGNGARLGMLRSGLGRQPRVLWLLLVPFAGVYSGHWPLLEAAGMALAMVLIDALVRRGLDVGTAVALLLESLRAFGRLALLLGLGLAWFALVFDLGVERQWLNALIVHLPSPFWANWLIGLWLSAVWILAAWLLRPLPALIIGAPWLLPASLHSGLAATLISLITLLSLYAGDQLRAAGRGGDLSARRLVVPGLTVLLLLAMPDVARWLGD